MPTKQYALEAGGPERVEIAWQGFWKGLSVRVDGRPLGSFADQKALKAGREFVLEDGTTLRVQLAQVGLTPELQLTRNGEPLPGSAGDPEQRLAAAYGVLYFVAGFNVLLGLVAGMARIQLLQNLGVGFASIVSGAVYGVLGYFVKQRSRLALALAVALFVLDGGFFVVTVARAGGTPPFGAILVRVFLLVAMVQGFPAIGALEKAESAPVRRPPRTSRSAAGPPRLGGGAAPASAPAPAAPLPAAPVAHVLSGEAERRRLELSQRLAPTAPPPAVGATKIGKPTAGDRPVAGWGRDVGAEALRFVAHKCQLGEAGLHVTLPNVTTRDLAWSEIAVLCVRQLPSDPPWDARILLDLVPASTPAAPGTPVRVLSTTFVNYAALPGGASTSRLENLRHLAAHVVERQPSVALDPETTAFLQGGKAPARFVTMAQFAEYDARLG